MPGALRIKVAVDKPEKSNAQIGRDFEIVSNTLYIILKDKNKILNAHASGDFTGERKKIWRPDFFQVDDALLLFFKKATTKGIPIGGLQLLDKGKEIAEGLRLLIFSMSQGWLDRWKLPPIYQNTFFFIPYYGKKIFLADDLTGHLLTLLWPLVVIWVYKIVDRGHVGKRPLCRSELNSKNARVSQTIDRKGR